MRTKTDSLNCSANIFGIFGIEVICLSILIVILITAVVVLVLYLIATIIDWGNESPDAAKLKFKSFLSFYRVNPERWELYNNLVCFKKPNKFIYYKGLEDFESIQFRFGFFDWLKYKRWRNHNKKQEENLSYQKDIATMLSIVKQDIEAEENKAAQYTRQAKHNIECGLGLTPINTITDEQIKRIMDFEVK